MAEERATSAQGAQRRAQDNRGAVTVARLETGSVVYVKDMRPDHKLAHRFLGPFKVVKDAVGDESDQMSRHC